MLKYRKILAPFLSICLLVTCLSISGTVYASSGSYPYEDQGSVDVNSPLPNWMLSNDVLPVNAGALETNCKSCILMERSTGNVLYEDNADEKCAPASITKIMTLLLAMEAIDSGKISLNDVVTGSEHACSMGGSQIWLKVGETFTLDEMIKATVVASANDTTVALAEHVCGSEETFIDLMNKRAAELGMTNTHFVNSYGLDDDNHYTTARDVGIMSCELLKHDLIKNYTTIWMDTLRNGTSSLVNTNKLVRFYNGTTGLKTGTTSKAGKCVAASANRDNMELVAVVMGADTSDHRFGTARKLLDYGFANWKLTDPEFNTDELTPVTVLKGKSKEVHPEIKMNSKILVGSGDADKLTYKIKLSDNVTAPVERGQNIGSACVYKDDQEIACFPIVSSERVDKSSYFWNLWRVIKCMLI